MNGEEIAVKHANTLGPIERQALDLEFQINRCLHRNVKQGEEAHRNIARLVGELRVEKDFNNGTNCKKDIFTYT